MNNNNIIIKRLTKTADSFEESAKRIEEYLATHQDEIKELEKEYGKFDRYYVAPNTLIFKKENVQLPDKDQHDWYYLWNSVIVNQFEEFMKKENIEGDFEFEHDTGNMTVWTEENGMPRKLFFHTNIFGEVENAFSIRNRATEIRYRNSTYRPVKEQIKFEFIGDKY